MGTFYKRGRLFSQSPTSEINAAIEANEPPLYFATLATAVALPSVTYNNGAGTLTATANGAVGLIDDVTVSLGDYILVKNQVSQLQNGLYEVTTLGTAGAPFVLTRLDEYNETAEIYPSQVNIINGISNGGLFYLQTTVNPTIGVDNIIYTSKASTQASASKLTFVDTVTSSALLNSPTYSNGTSASFPALNATYVATTNGSFPAVQGVYPFVGMKILVKDEADQTKNGDYVLTNKGSLGSKWKMRRISYTSSMFYPRDWQVLAGDLQGDIYTQNNKSLVNSTIGSSGNITFTANPYYAPLASPTFTGTVTAPVLKLSTALNNDDALTQLLVRAADGTVKYRSSSSISSSGVFGIANSSGVYTYYSTFTLAMAAASAGQTIEMFADVTETSAVTITIKNGVNIDGHNHTYTLNVSGTNNAFDITTNSYGSVAWSMKWSNMTVIRAGSSSGGTSDVTACCFYCTSNQNSVEAYIQFSGVLFKNTGSGCCVGISGPMMLDGLYMQLANGADCFYSNSVYAHLKRCNAVNTSSGRGIVLGGGGTGEYCYATSSTGSAFTGGNLHFCKGYSPSSGVGIDSPTYVYNCIGISSSSVGIYAINTAELVNSIGISVSNFGIQASGGSLYVKSCTGISSSSYGLRTSGDTPFLIDCKGFSTSGVGAYISHNGYTKVVGGFFQTLWNNSAGYGAFIGGIASVSKATFAPTHASAYNLYYSAPVNIKIYQNSFIGGAGIHSNITNTMSNTEDNYGNITE